MRLAFTSALLVLATLSSGCSTITSLEPAPGSKVEYTQGLPVLVSEQPGSVVQIMPSKSEYENADRVLLWVSVRNSSPSSVDFDSTSVSAADGDKLVRVFSYDEVVREIKRRAMWASVAQALSAAGDSMSAANAGYSTSNTTGTMSATDNYGGYARGTYQSTTTTYDAGAAAAAQARVDAKNREQMAQIASARDNDLALAQQLVRRTTLSPGESLTGGLVVEAPPGSALNLRVTVGADVHEFGFNYIKK